LDFHGKENIAREIAWLKASRHILLEARRAKKGGVAPVMDDVVKPKLNINHNLGRAIKENDRVYLMRILVVDFFPPLAKAVLAKSTLVFEVLDASHEKMFVGLKLNSSTKALSKYTKMVNNIVQMQVEKLQTESEMTCVKLREMDLLGFFVFLKEMRLFLTSCEMMLRLFNWMRACSSRSGDATVMCFALSE
jgi:programmed cell death 6-interacting protein